MIRLIIFLFLLASLSGLAGPKERRAELQGLMQKGRYAQALELAEPLIAELDDAESGNDLMAGVIALQQLTRPAEAELLLRKVLVAKAENWRVWWAAARGMNGFQVRYGILDEGRFLRGTSGAEELWSGDRDRAESLQWYLEAWQRGGQDAGNSEKLRLLEELSRVVQRKSYGWMTRKTHGELLPAYGEVVPTVPEFEKINRAIRSVDSPWEAGNDGELFKWALTVAKGLGRRPSEEYDAAFGEAIMDHYGLPRGHAVDWWSPDNAFEDKLRGLPDTAYLEDGLVRQIVAENAFIPLLEPMAMSPRPANPAAERARVRIAEFRRARLQYDRLAKQIRAWLRVIPQERGDDIDQDDAESSEGADLSSTPKGRWIEKLEELIGVHVEIPQVDRSFPVGRPPELTLLLQNSADFVVTAQPIDLRALLRRIETYLRSDPKELELDRMDLDYLQEKILLGGWRDLLGEEAFRHRYLVPKSDWHRPMPRKIRLPLDRGGPWMVSYELPSGDQYFQLIWMADLSAVMHHGGGESKLYLIDAIEGKPVPRAKLTVLGWKRLQRGDGSHRLLVSRFQRRADEQGLVRLGAKSLPEDFTWMMWMESGSRLSVLPELSRFRPNLQGSPSERMRVHVLPESFSAKPGTEIDLSVLIGFADHLSSEASQERLQGKKLKVSLRSKDVVVAPQEIELDAFGTGMVRYQLPKDLLPGSYRWVIESDDLPGLTQNGPAKKRPGLEDLSPVLTGRYEFEVLELEESSVSRLNGPLVEVADWEQPFTYEMALPEEFDRAHAVLELAAVSAAAREPKSLTWCHSASEPGLLSGGQVLRVWRSTEIGEDGVARVPMDLRGLEPSELAGEFRLHVLDHGQVLAQGTAKLDESLLDQVIPEVTLSRQFIREGVPFQVQVAARSNQGDRLAAQGELLLERRFQNGFDLLDSRLLDIGEEGSTETLEVKDPGNYRLRLVINGQVDGLEDVVDFVCVSPSGGGSRIWTGDLDETIEPPLVHLIAERSDWQLGETPTILVQSRWPEQTLIFLHGNSVVGYQSQLVKTQDYGAFVQLPVGMDLAPDLTALALVVRGARLGRHEIPVRLTPPSRELNLQLSSIDPETAKLTVKAADGAPREARIFVRFLAAEPSSEVKWRTPLASFWQWRNPNWWGLSHSLRSFGSRGFADIISNQAGLGGATPSPPVTRSAAKLQSEWSLVESGLQEAPSEIQSFVSDAKGELEIPITRAEGRWIEVIAVGAQMEMGFVSGSLDDVAPPPKVISSEK